MGAVIKSLVAFFSINCMYCIYTWLQIGSTVDITYGFFYLYIDEWKFRRFVIWKMYVAVFMACLLGECVGFQHDVVTSLDGKLD